MSQQQTIEKTPEFQRAIDLFEDSKGHIFLTGRAGTGKSTLLQFFRTSTQKNVVVLAPTGVAAVNVKGQTLHSFFRFRPDITPETVKDIHIRRAQREVYKHLDVVIIDEISMVRADLLDCIDRFLRIYGKKKSKPFGGIRIVMVGDLYQLPPVVTRREQEMFAKVYPSPYFFHAKVFEEIDLEFLELETIWRQKEDRFVNLLNAVRTNSVSDQDMQLLNSRCQAEDAPVTDELYVYLTTTNDLADDVNHRQLNALSGRAFDLCGEVDGKFEDRALPTKEALQVKLGAQVMLLNNDPFGRWVNGSIGVVTDVIHGGDEDAVRVRLAEGGDVDVGKVTWEMYRFIYDDEQERVTSEVIGAFTQYPLRLAWAVTIHKAQGKTFSKVIIDVGRGTFSHGQVYVALSRCTSLKGVVLKRPILRRHIMMDQRVHSFLENFKKQMQARHLVLE